MLRVVSVRCVVDTNIWLSGLANKASAPGIIVKNAVAGNLVPVFSIESFAELAEVLHRPKILRWLGLANLEAIEFLDALELIAVFVQPTLRLPTQVRDPKDVKILATALARPLVDALVTGDVDLLVLQGHVAIEIIAPSLFVAKYALR